MLQVHCSLKVLKVTVASHAQGAEIARALSKNSSLTELTIHGPVDNATRAAIEAVLERNRGVGPQQVMSAKQNPHPAESNEAAQQFDGMKSLQLAYPYKKPPATASNRPASAPLKVTPPLFAPGQRMSLQHCHDELLAFSIHLNGPHNCEVDDATRGKYASSNAI